MERKILAILILYIATILTFFTPWLELILVYGDIVRFLIYLAVATAWLLVAIAITALLRQKDYQLKSTRLFFDVWFAFISCIIVFIFMSIFFWPLGSPPVIYQGAIFVESMLLVLIYLIFRIMQQIRKKQIY